MHLKDLMHLNMAKHHFIFEQTSYQNIQANIPNNQIYPLSFNTHRFPIVIDLIAVRNIAPYRSTKSRRQNEFEGSERRRRPWLCLCNSLWYGPVRYEIIDISCRIETRNGACDFLFQNKLFYELLLLTGLYLIL